MRRDERLAGALLAHGADPNARVGNWTPTRRASQDFNFPPALVGATPFWLAGRFREPGIMRLLARHGADPSFVHRVDYVTSRQRRPAQGSADGADGGDGRARQHQRAGVGSA